jgi:hypothetical protein
MTERRPQDEIAAALERFEGRSCSESVEDTDTAGFAGGLVRSGGRL